MINIENVELELIGIKTGSSLFNWFSFVSWILIYLILNILVWLIPNITPQENSYKWIKLCEYIIVKLNEFFTFTIYIRTFMESYQFLLLSNISNLRDYDVSTDSQITSLSFSSVMLILWILFMIVSFIMFLKTSKKSRIEKRLKWGEFLSGVRDNKIAKIYWFLSLLRRFLMISWLLLSKSFIVGGYVDALLFVQIPYFIFFIIVSPFDKVKDNLIEGTNELFLIVIISYMCHFNAEPKWTGSASQVFVYIILGNTIVVMVILIGNNYISYFFH